MSFRERRAPVAANDVRRFRDGLLADGVVVAKADAGARELSPVAIGPEEGEALLAWVRKERAHRTLESGLGFAMSTLYICEGLLANGGDGLHVAADPYQFVSLPLHSTTYARVGLQVLAVRWSLALLPCPRRGAHPPGPLRAPQHRGASGVDRAGEARGRRRVARAHPGSDRGPGARITRPRDGGVLGAHRMGHHPLPSGPDRSSTRTAVTGLSGLDSPSTRWSPPPMTKVAPVTAVLVMGERPARRRRPGRRRVGSAALYAWQERLRMAGRCAIA